MGRESDSNKTDFFFVYICRILHKEKNVNKNSGFILIRFGVGLISPVYSQI